jgi:pimeloyl-ACP methyl ester carboxylesterase
MVAFNGGGVGEELHVRRGKAEELRAASGGNALVTSDIFDVWPLSVDTYLEATHESGRWDLFPTREKSIGALNSIDVPSFVAIGGSDFASYPDPQTAASLVKWQSPKTHLALIEEAPHNFAGYEGSLERELNNFLETLTIR